MYRALLDREPDEDGLREYTRRVQAGLTVDGLVRSVLDSEEYQTRAQAPRSSEPTEPEASTAPPGPVVPPDYISPDEVMGRLSLDALNESADEYYRRVPDATPLMSKPFTFLHEAPETLQSLGHLLAGLHLGKTMRVLDFGAGTGWLSRMLTQLNCEVIACDVSPAALAIGRRLFVEHPLIGTVAYAPTFLPFDGRRLDLPDASIDRVVCFDAFHHVPNQAEVLREIGRVLRPGGIAGFSEPGRWHSRSAQSQYEMRHHRVLENDIHLESIFECARAGGFTRLTTRLLADREVDLEDYLRIIGRDARADDAVRDATRDAMINRSIFFLHKGDRRLDSRGHEGLAHAMTIQAAVEAVPAGTPVRVRARLENTGAAHWLHTNSQIFGIVRLAAHLCASDGRLLNLDHFRTDLPAPVAPGESVVVETEVPMPGPGEFILQFDLVAEGVTWFENVGSRTSDVRVRVI